MDTGASPIPSPSVAWSHLAASQGEIVRADATPRAATPSNGKEEATALRARLLRMIVDSENSRKAASAETFHAR
jgi:hypothetical protein